ETSFAMNGEASIRSRCFNRYSCRGLHLGPCIYAIKSISHHTIQSSEPAFAAKPPADEPLIHYENSRSKIRERHRTAGVSECLSIIVLTPTNTSTQAIQSNSCTCSTCSSIN